MIADVSISNIAFYRRALLTDGYLRVKGANGIFALGDCSTIEQDTMINKAQQLFEKAIESLESRKAKGRIRRVEQIF